MLRIMKKFTYIMLLSLLMYGCANRLPLTGGPEDKTPPEIISFSPQPLTTNFLDNEITIEFSKYMNKMQVEENVFFSPTIEYEANWSGRQLEIELQQQPDTNTTYALMIGTDYSDIRGNKPTEQFNLVFSTGNVIDTGKIEGKLYDEDPMGSYIFAFRIDDMDIDTFDICGTKAQYRSQVGTSGNFSIPALKDGNYRLFAIRDKFDNQIYDTGIDEFGAPSQDYQVNAGTSDFVHIKSGPPIDNNGQMLFDAFARTDRIISLNFSEPLDTASVSKGSVILMDSASKEQLEVLSVYLKPGSPTEIDMVLQEDVDTSSVLIAIIPLDISSVLSDTLSNPIQDTANSISFMPYPEEKFLVPRLLTTPFKDSTMNVMPDEKFTFVFNTAMPDELKDKVELRDLQDSSIIAVSKELSGNILSIRPKKQLKSDAWFLITMNFDGITALNGRDVKDSVQSLRFKTKDIRNYGSVFGSVKDPEEGCTYIVILRSKITKQNIYSDRCSYEGNWEFLQIPPETYQIEVFCDMNEDGLYSYGNDQPFHYSEKFYVLKQEIVLQPRWEVEDVILTLPDKDR